MRIALCHRFVVLWLSLVSVVSAQAQPERMLTADDAVRMGLQHSRSLEAAQAQADVARLAYVQARDQRLPRFESTASYTRLSSNIPEIGVDFPPLPGLDTTSFTLAPIELNRYYTQLSVEQPIFTGFRLQRSIESASHQAEAARFDVRQEEVEVAFQIRQAYWNLYRATSVRAVLENALAQVEAYLSEVRNRQSVGAALESDVLSASTRRSEVLLDRMEADNNIRVARLELNRLTGAPLTTETDLAVEARVEPLTESVEVLVEQAIRSRPGLQSFSEQIRAYAADVRGARAAWYPSVAFSGRYVYARPNQYFFTEQNQFKGTWEAGITMNWTIWNWGQRAAEVGQARARLSNAEARYEQAREAIAVEINSRYLEVQRTTEAIAVVEEIVREAEETFRVVRNRYAEGAATTAEVLDAEYVLRRAQSRRADSFAAYETARAGLLQATGRVW